MMIHLAVFIALSHGYVEANLQKHQFETKQECQQFLNTDQFKDELLELFGFLNVNPQTTTWMVKCVKSGEQST